MFRRKSLLDESTNISSSSQEQSSSGTTTSSIMKDFGFATPGSSLSRDNRQTLEEIKVQIQLSTIESLSPDIGVQNNCAATVNTVINNNTSYEVILAEVVFLLCKKISTRNPKVDYLALSLIEALMNSCGDEFHSAINTDYYAKTYSKLLVYYKTQTKQEAKNVYYFGLDLVQAWGEAFYNNARNRQHFVLLYDTLKRESAPFKILRENISAEMFSKSLSSTNNSGHDSTGRPYPVSRKKSLDGEKMAAFLPNPALTRRLSLNSIPKQTTPTNLKASPAKPILNLDKFAAASGMTSPVDTKRRMSVDSLTPTSRSPSFNNNNNNNNYSPNTSNARTTPLQLASNTNAKRVSNIKLPNIATSLEASVSLLKELIVNSSSSSELLRNEIAIELEQTITQEQKKFSVTIQMEASSAGEVLPDLISINDQVTAVIQLYENVISNKIPLHIVKQQHAAETYTLSPSGGEVDLLNMDSAAPLSAFQAATNTSTSNTSLFDMFDSTASVSTPQRATGGAGATAGGSAVGSYHIFDSMPNQLSQFSPPQQQAQQQQQKASPSSIFDTFAAATPVKTSPSQPQQLHQQQQHQPGFDPFLTSNAVPSTSTSSTVTPTQKKQPDFDAFFTSTMEQFSVAPTPVLPQSPYQHLQQQPQQRSPHGRQGQLQGQGYVTNPFAPQTYSIPSPFPATAAQSHPQQTQAQTPPVISTLNRQHSNNPFDFIE